MSIEDLINNVNNQDFAKAGPTFVEIMQTKMGDALEQEKIAVADQVFNGASEEDEDEDIDDITDEEMEDALDELDDYEDDYDNYDDEDEYDDDYDE